MSREEEYWQNVLLEKSFRKCDSALILGALYLHRYHQARFPQVYCILGNSHYRKGFIKRDPGTIHRYIGVEDKNGKYGISPSNYGTPFGENRYQNIDYKELPDPFNSILKTSDWKEIIKELEDREGGSWDDYELIPLFENGIPSYYFSRNYLPSPLEDCMTSIDKYEIEAMRKLLIELHRAGS